MSLCKYFNAFAFSARPSRRRHYKIRLIELTLSSLENVEQLGWYMGDPPPLGQLHELHMVNFDF